MKTKRPTGSTGPDSSDTVTCVEPHCPCGTVTTEGLAEIENENPVVAVVLVVVVVVTEELTVMLTGLDDFVSVGDPLSVTQSSKFQIPEKPSVPVDDEGALEVVQEKELPRSE